MNLLVAKRALGVVSIAVGVVAVADPRRVGSLLGLPVEEQAVSAFGAREIASGAGLLSPVRPGPWFWLRSAGDVLDLSTLARAIGPDNPRRNLARLAFGALALIAVVDFAVTAHAALDRREDARAAR